MSKKHHQRTRAEILAKRAQPIIDIPVRKNIGSFLAPIWKEQAPRQNADVRRAKRSKYTPHFGVRQRKRLADKLPKAAPLAA